VNGEQSSRSCRRSLQAQVGRFYAEACKCSLDFLPAGYGNARSLRTRRSRWLANGTLPQLMEAGEHVIRRMRREYAGLIRDASDVDSPDWQTSSEFFGHGDAIPWQPHLQPKGRYADRLR
jgi:hypothetical protein